MENKHKNPIKLLSQHKFTLPQIIVIVGLVGGLAFAGGLSWRNYQKRLAHEAATQVALAEADRLAKLKAEEELNENMKKEEKPAEKQKPKSVPKPAPVQATETASLYLTGSQTGKGVNLNWSTANLSTAKGFKLLKSKSGTPVFGSDHTSAIYISDAAARGHMWGLTDGKTYFFRICTYNGSNCSFYSNTIKVNTPRIAPTKPTGSITLSATGESPSSNPLSWSVSGGKALYGYKLVWSTNNAPTYPKDISKMYDKGATSGSISGKSGTYNVRVCMYYEKTCLNYSNSVQVTIP